MSFYSLSCIEALRRRHQGRTPVRRSLPGARRRQPGRNGREGPLKPEGGGRALPGGP